MCRACYKWRLGDFGCSLVFSIFSLAGSAWSQQTATPAAPAPGSDAKSYVDFGTSIGAKGDLNGAVSAFTLAISLDPKYAPAYYNRGLAYSLQYNDSARPGFMPERTAVYPGIRRARRFALPKQSPRVRRAPKNLLRPIGSWRICISSAQWDAKASTTIDCHYMLR